MYPEAETFLNMLRKGPVSHVEASRRFGAYQLGAYKRILAGQGHILSTSYERAGTKYRLLRDADDQLKLEGGEA